MKRCIDIMVLVSTTCWENEQSASGLKKDDSTFKHDTVELLAGQEHLVDVFVMTPLVRSEAATFVVQLLALIMTDDATSCCCVEGRLVYTADLPGRETQQEET
jgi:hypothetical protein